MKNNKPVVLLLDIETAPLLSFTWGIWQQDVALSQVNKDWHLLSWSAKYYRNDSGEVFGPHNKIMYADQRKAKNVENDRKLLGSIWKLLDSADIVITQNGISFDAKKLNARFIINGFKPPRSYKHIDTKRIATKKFGFTSNKLEYLTEKLCKTYKKSKHKKFSGFELWKECLAGNEKAWKEMEHYNKLDVLALEELYNKLQPWDNNLNVNIYNDNIINKCSCGSNQLKKNGFAYTSSGKYQRFVCSSCGSETRSKKNLFNKEKRESLKTKI